MFKTFLRYASVLFGGLLLGQVPVGQTTIGRAAWQSTQDLVSWSGKQATSLVKQAGLNDISWDWVPGKEAKKKEVVKEVKKLETPRPIDAHPNAADRDAIRQLLEE
ncbi:hypothetical protein K2X33_08920 [bacterium]|nr:hypothetical protein [bacterium]